MTCVSPDSGTSVKGEYAAIIFVVAVVVESWEVVAERRRACFLLMNCQTLKYWIVRHGRRRLCVGIISVKYTERRMFSVFAGRPSHRKIQSGANLFREDTKHENGTCFGSFEAERVPGFEHVIVNLFRVQPDFKLQLASDGDVLELIYLLIRNLTVAILYSTIVIQVYVTFADKVALLRYKHRIQRMSRAHNMLYVRDLDAVL